MAEYIDREKLIKDLKESAKHQADSIREESLLLKDRLLVREQPTADVVERSKIDKAIEEMINQEDLDGIDRQIVRHCIEILKRNIGENGVVDNES